MYHTHWGLTCSPFVGGSPLFYQGESQREALARLRYAADQQRHAVLLGERGVGKSLLLQRYAVERRQRGGGVVLIGLAGLSPRELLWQLAAGLSLAPRPEDDAIRLFRRLADAAAAGTTGVSTLLLLDDAEQAGADTRTQILRLLGLGSGAPWLTLVIVAGLRAAAHLGEELLDAADLRIDLEPWSEADAIGYVQHSLVEAGASRPIFEDEALAALYALTDGIPRRVTRLADHALLGAAAEGHDTVDAAMVEAAHDAVSWTVAGNS
jgi:general secretion pathway protein A